jgi:hypothetical protein
MRLTMASDISSRILQILPEQATQRRVSDDGRYEWLDSRYKDNLGCIRVCCGPAVRVPAFRPHIRLSVPEKGSDLPSVGHAMVGDSGGAKLGGQYARARYIGYCCSSTRTPKETPIISFRSAFFPIEVLERPQLPWRSGWKPFSG